MPCARHHPLALIVCCGVAALAAGDAAAQGMTPLRVDPVLLGLPPVEKKAPTPPKPAVPADAPRADVKPVDAQAVEAKPLPADGEVAATSGEQPKIGASSRPRAAASPDRIPARAVAPAPAAAADAPVEVAPATPKPAQSRSPGLAAPAPRPREEESDRASAPTVDTPAVAAPPQPARPAAVAPAPAPKSAAAPVPVGKPVDGKVTTLAPLRVHPGLLGLPVVAGAAGPVASGSGVSPAGRSVAAGGVAGAAVGPGLPVAPATPAATLATLEERQREDWRAGQPPLLSFPDAAPVLPQGGAGEPGLRLAKGLSPLKNESDLPRPMFLTADELSGITDREAVAQGNAEARKVGTVVNADRMTYWPVEDELEATGNVRLAQGDDLVTGPRMRMKIEAQTGVFDQPNYFLKREPKWAKQQQAQGGSTWALANNAVEEPKSGTLSAVLGMVHESKPLAMTEAHGAAERIDFEGENKLRVISGDYTTCKPGDPGWYIKADELALDYDREVGEGKNGTLYFQNTPILWSPWLSFSLNNQRKSGLLAPTIGTSSANGVVVSTPYYWNIAPDMDAVLTPRLYAKRGLQLASELRYLGHNYSGQSRVEVMPDDRLYDKGSRYAYSVTHNHNLGNGFTGNLNLSGVSDDTYFTDMSSRSTVTSQTQLLRQGSLNYGSTWWSANVIAQAYQTLQPDPSVTVTKPYSLLPQVNLNARRPDFYLTDVAFAGQYTAFSSATLDQGRRMVAYPQIAVPFVQPGFYVTPKIGAHVTSYSLERRTTTGPDTISRNLPIFSVDAGMTFERQTAWFGAEALQTLEPRLYYLNVPYRDQSQIPVFDSGLADFNFAQIFSENQFVGYDRVSDANQLTAAVVSRLIDPASGAEAMRAMFGQRYYFQNQRVTLPGQTLSAWNKSDFLAAFSGRVLPKTYLDTALQYSPQNTRTERFSVGARYQPELGKVLNASYRFTRDALENVDIAGQWPIWGGWSAVGRYNYSLKDHQPVETVGGLEYNAGCWALRLVGHQVATLSGKTNTSLFVQLELTDFARIGSNPIDLLKRNIQGYGLTNQPVADPVFGD